MSRGRKGGKTGGNSNHANTVPKQQEDGEAGSSGGVEGNTVTGGNGGGGSNQDSKAGDHSVSTTQDKDKHTLPNDDTHASSHGSMVSKQQEEQDVESGGIGTSSGTKKGNKNGDHMISSQDKDRDPLPSGDTSSHGSTVPKRQEDGEAGSGDVGSSIVTGSNGGGSGGKKGSKGTGDNMISTQDTHISSSHDPVVPERQEDGEAGSGGLGNSSGTVTGANEGGSGGKKKSSKPSGISVSTQDKDRDTLPHADTHTSGHGSTVSKQQLQPEQQDVGSSDQGTVTGGNGGGSGKKKGSKAGGNMEGNGGNSNHANTVSKQQEDGEVGSSGGGGNSSGVQGTGGSSGNSSGVQGTGGSSGNSSGVQGTGGSGGNSCGVQGTGGSSGNSCGVQGTGGSSGKKKGSKTSGISVSTQDKDLPNGDIHPPASRGAVSSSGGDGDGSSSGGDGDGSSSGGDGDGSSSGGDGNGSSSGGDGNGGGGGKNGGNGSKTTQNRDKDILRNADIHPPATRGTVGSSGGDGNGGGGGIKGSKAGSNGSKAVSSQHTERDLPNGDIHPPATRGSSGGVQGDQGGRGSSCSKKKGNKTGGNNATTDNSNHANSNMGNSVHANGLSRQQQEEEESRQAKLLEKIASFLLVDENEEMQVRSVEDFVSRLGCGAGDQLKVVSIFGNIGEGKSHTLNHTLFNGREVFRTSDSQDSCTVGVWVAFDPVHRVIVVDTEGLHGNSGGKQHGQRGRLLLKILALSDVVVYRTHADRLGDQLFRFLLDASEAYLKFFTRQLTATAQRLGTDVPLSTLGPSVLVFHETVHTALLGSEGLLQERFRRMGRVPEAFSSVRYCGVQTKAPPTDFRVLKHTLETQLRNQSTRAPRTPGVIYNALKVLSDRFSGEISDELITHTCFFPDEYFTCPALCLACGSGCKNSMNHLREGVPHEAKHRCQYSNHHDNRLFTCKVCYEAGKEVIVVPKTSASSDSPWLGLARYAWSGYVIECPTCGVIYRSREFWFGNMDPVNTVVRTEIQHIWPGCDGLLKDNSNAAQRLLDGVSLVAQSVSELSGKPTRTLSSWITDQIAPPYWKPNALILGCHKCGEVFHGSESKHHCRACGEGFCDWCSSKLRPVPERGWGQTPVRVCDACYEHKGAHSTGLQLECEDEESGTLARKVGEAVGEAVSNTLGAVATAMDIPLGLVKDAARPAYWVPDQNMASCSGCHRGFSARVSRHHCRACGQCVCDECSTARRPVPSRGWDHPVRVCSACNEKNNDL